jgi:hypothetical protein
VLFRLLISDSISSTLYQSSSSIFFSTDSIVTYSLRQNTWVNFAWWKNVTKDFLLQETGEKLSIQVSDKLA